MDKVDQFFFLLILVFISVPLIFIAVFASVLQEMIMKSIQRAKNYIPKLMTVDEMQKKIIEVAIVRNGIVNPLEIAGDTNISVNDAWNVLIDLARKGYIEIKVDESGGILYEFPDFVKPQHNQ